MAEGLRLVFLGLSITSSWGNGHATNYRGLLRALTARGHNCLFLERDVPWYQAARDMPSPPFGRAALYTSLQELRQQWAWEIAAADAVVVGSYVPEGVLVGRWIQETARGITAFYDIDTPVTLAKLARGDFEYLAPSMIPGYDLYLSFTGGPTLDYIERHYRAPRARPFYCLVDPDLYHPDTSAVLDSDLGYLGTYSKDRQPALERLLMGPARRMPDCRFIVAGPKYPPGIQWPPNVSRIEHLPPSEHRSFYTRQRFTLNTTRADMVRAGYSPSVRLFEAAACGTPIISDRWAGIDEFFVPGEEILLADSTDDVVRLLRQIPERERLEIGRRARQRVLSEHTAERRAQQFEEYVQEVRNRAIPSGVDA